MSIERTFTERQKRVFLQIAAILLMLLAIWQLCLYTEKRLTAELRREGESRALFYAESLQDSLEKFRHLPYVLARDARIRALLEYSVPAVRVNPHLEDFGHATGALIFVLDKGGTTLASSNWRSAKSLMGHNFCFRPYFIDAAEKKAGGYYAFGLQTRKPGYFLSYPVLKAGELLGVVVVKVDLLSLQKSWMDGGETVIVSDSYGVVILSSNTGWTYSTLKPLSDKTRNILRASQYLEHPLESLPVQRTNTPRGNILHISDKPYLEISQQLPEYGWRLHYLSDMQRVINGVRLSLGVSTSGFVIMFLLLLYYRERRQKILSLQKARDAEEIRQLNILLRREIVEREQTEQDLIQAQKELVQSGKLAALGRMSAAVAHELNQPVTAIRMFLASSRKLLERGEMEKIDKTLTLISGLTDRMAGITGQLKSFARKDGERGEPVDLCLLVNRVGAFMKPQLEEKGVTWTSRLIEEGRAVIKGDEIRIEQVLTNLVKNSIDAVQESAVKEIRIGVRVVEGTVKLSVKDSGQGIAEEAFDYLFEPFFTTKDGAEGLGLGLSITYGIIEDLGGKIHVGNCPGGGAEFVATFPLWERERSDS